MLEDSPLGLLKAQGDVWNIHLAKAELTVFAFFIFGVFGGILADAESAGPNGP